MRRPPQWKYTVGVHVRSFTWLNDMLDCSEGQQEGVPPFSPALPLLNQASRGHPSARRQTERQREVGGRRGGLRRWRCKPDWWRRLRRERLWQMWWLQTQWPEYHRASWELFWRENHVSKNYKEEHWSHIHTRQMRQGWGRRGGGRGVMVVVGRTEAESQRHSNPTRFPLSLFGNPKISSRLAHLMKETKGVDGLDFLLAPPRNPTAPPALGFSLDVSVGLGPGVRLEPARSRVSDEHESQSDQAKHTGGVSRVVNGVTNTHSPSALHKMNIKMQRLFPPPPPKWTTAMNEYPHTLCLFFPYILRC